MSHQISIDAEMVHRYSNQYVFGLTKFFYETAHSIAASGMDLETFIVLQCLANASVTPVFSKPDGALRYPSLFDEVREEYAYTPLAPLARACGLPRTTARRKLQKLIDTGFAEFCPVNGYRVVKGAIVNSPAIHAVYMSHLNRMSRLINGMLKKGMIALEAHREVA